MDAWHMCIPLVWALLPPVLLLVISFARATFVSRYLSAIAPGIALVVAIGLGAVVDAVAKRRGGVSQDARTMASFGVVGVLLVAAFGVTNYRAMGSTYSQEWDKLVATLVRESRPSDGILMYSDLSRPAIEAELAQVDHGPMPHILNMERQFGPPVRVVAHVAPTYSNRRRLVRYERIWTVTVGSEEIESAFYAKTPPLSTNYRLAGTWEFQAGWPTVLRLYVRVTPIDYFPTIS